MTTLTGTPAPLEAYLRRATVGLPPERREEVWNELEEHVLNRAEQLEFQGHPPKEALEQALRELGPPLRVSAAMNAQPSVVPPRLRDDYVLAETETDREITVGATTLRCRMDAVFRRSDGAGWLIVDWKTGRRQVPVDQLSVYVHAWAASQGVPTGSVRAAYVYVDYPGGRVDELTAAGLLDLDQIESALTPGSPPDEMTPLPAPEQQG